MLIIALNDTAANLPCKWKHARNVRSSIIKEIWSRSLFLASIAIQLTVPLCHAKCWRFSTTACTGLDARAVFSKIVTMQQNFYRLVRRGFQNSTKFPAIVFRCARLLDYRPLQQSRGHDANVEELAVICVANAGRWAFHAIVAVMLLQKSAVKMPNESNVSLVAIYVKFSE
jgi:hypothetical protein